MPSCSLGSASAGFSGAPANLGRPSHPKSRLQSWWALRSAAPLLVECPVRILQFDGSAQDQLEQPLASSGPTSRRPPPAQKRGKSGHKQARYPGFVDDVISAYLEPAHESFEVHPTGREHEWDLRKPWVGFDPEAQLESIEAWHVDV